MRIIILANESKNHDMITYTKELQEKLSPDQALNILKEGNARFLKGEKEERDLIEQAEITGKGQAPFATVLGCMDSRVSNELIFDQGIGDIFSIRIAGNVVNDDIIGSLEFATELVGTKVVLVLGHTKCGAVTGACNGVEMGKLTDVLSRVKPAIKAETQTTDNRTGDNAEFVSNVTRLNVELTMQEITKQSPIIKKLVDAGKVKIAGAIYHVEDGRVEFL